MKLIRTKEDFIIARLEELIDDRKSLMGNDPEHDEIYIKDIEALKCARAVLKDTAHWNINCDGYYPYCSGCGSEPPGREMSRYCPNCGRRMVTPERRKA